MERKRGRRLGGPGQASGFGAIPFQTPSGCPKGNVQEAGEHGEALAEVGWSKSELECVGTGEGSAGSCLLELLGV